MMTTELKTAAIVLGTLAYGGAERQAIELARHLPAFGWRAVFLVARMEGELIPVAREMGVPLYDLGAEFHRSKVSPGFWINLSKTINRAREAMDRENAAVVQSLLFWEDIIAVPAAKRGRIKRPVITSRLNAGTFKDLRPHYRWVDRVLNPYVDAIVCNSESVRDINLTREKGNAARMRVIHNGVEYDRFANAKPADIASEFPQLADAKPLVLILGALKQEKRHDVFIRAMKELRLKVPTAKALAIGPDRGLEAKIRQLISREGMEDVVMLGGPRHNPENYLAACDLFVLSSENEGFPNVVLEAMCCGKAVVSTLVAGSREAVIPGETGVLVPVSDAPAIASALSELHANPERAREMGKRGQERVRELFTLEKMAQRYAELFEELTGAYRKPQK